VKAEPLVELRDGQATRPDAAVGGFGATVMRAVTREKAALLDSAEAADEQGRAAARTVLEALAKTKKADG